MPGERSVLAWVRGERIAAVGSVYKQFELSFRREDREQNIEKLSVVLARRATRVHLEGHALPRAAGLGKVAECVSGL